MTSNNCAIFKIFLKYGGTTEVRKFVVDDASVITSFIFMKEKLQTHFPKLRESPFIITWRDAEGDDITIDSDDDLILAFTEMEGPVKTLYVTVSSHNRQQPNQYIHGPSTSRIVCDVCNNPITAWRYKCLQCVDYDLCSNCEHAGHHSHHMMLRSSSTELPFTRCSRKIAEQIGKAAKKANHMAYKESCRAAKFARSQWERKSKPECGESSGNETGNEGKKEKQQASGGCPFEQYVPQFYPLIDVISNTATNIAANAAAAAASAASAPQPGSTQPRSAQPGSAQPDSVQPGSTQPTFSAEQPTSTEQNQPNKEDIPTNQFIELIRRALSGVFVQPPHPQPTPHQAENQPQQTNSAPEATSDQAQPSAPSGVEQGIDLTSVEPMEVSSPRREPGWTLLNNEEPVTQPMYPVLTPTVVSPNQYLDPKIAAGLRQLLEMGFSDEQALIELLKRFNGSVDEVIKYIFEHN